MKLFWLTCTAVPVLLLGFAEGQKLPTKLIYNGSESAPLGFYWIENLAPKRGDYVLTDVPLRFKFLLEKRGYVPLHAPLLKQVIALEGDVICRKNREILLDGMTIAVAKLADQSGRKLPNWRGCHQLKSGELFLLQDHRDSFDGRYFGPLKDSFVIGKATKLRFSSGSAGNNDPTSSRNCRQDAEKSAEGSPNRTSSAMPLALAFAVWLIREPDVMVRPSQMRKEKRNECLYWPRCLTGGNLLLCYQPGR